MGQQHIIIHPFGQIGSDLQEALHTAIAARFGVNAIIGEQLPLPARSYSSERQQYRSTEFLKELTARKHEDKQTGLGVTAVDLFVPKLNFVFGEASSVDQVAVLSIARLDPRFYGEPKDGAILERRAITEAVHELGHVFGLAHCGQKECVMWFSNTLLETDRKRSEFCAQCARKIKLPSGR